jgi:hypothetical protein
MVMRRRAAVVLAAMILGSGLGAFVGGGPAAAGGWAVTVIDHLPGPIEAGTPYPVSFWVLQHGTHPYNWGKPASIGRVGLTLTDGRGTSVSFPGRALAEPAHYATTVTVPSSGRWRVTGQQGVFGGFHVGTLSVPGTLEALGVPAAPSPADLRKYWPGRVRPPVLPIDHQRDPYAPQVPDDDGSANGPAATTPAAAEPAIDPGSAGAAPVGRGVRTLLLAVVIGGVILALGLVVSGQRRRIRVRPDRATTR